MTDDFTRKELRKIGKVQRRLAWRRLINRIKGHRR